jgi:m7GpppX diphosphatase
MTPDSLVDSSDCLAQSLSVSNDHATILLRTTEYDKVIRSLLKITVLPTHTTALAPSSDLRDMQPDDLGAAFDPRESARIKEFLSSFNFDLSSESGAEYSYYDAIPKDGVGGMMKRLVGNIMKAKPVPTFRVELISPASEKQIQRAMPTASHVMIEETPELYNQTVAPYIQGLVGSGSLSWIDNIVTGKKEAERLLLDAGTYILNVDTKWKTHPDPRAVPKERWRSHAKAIDDLYCLAIVKESGIASLRDLRSQHIPMLKEMLEECPKAIEEVYGVQRNQLRIFFHYHPQFYHLHVHFTRLENEIGCQVERGHLLIDVIQNLEMDDEYYQKRTLTYKLRTNEKLYQIMQRVKSMRHITSDFADDELVDWDTGKTATVIAL